MFKCCMCSDTSKKDERMSEDSPIKSPRLTVVSTKAENEEIKSFTDKLNGSVQQRKNSKSTLDSSSTSSHSTFSTKNCCDNTGQNENAECTEEKSRSANTIKETPKSGGSPAAVGNNNNLDGNLTGEEDRVENSGVIPAKPANLYDASGYIDRTVDDGLDDEGDDSVFEACPSENETVKKAPAGNKNFSDSIVLIHV